MDFDYSEFGSNAFAARLDGNGDLIWNMFVGCLEDGQCMAMALDGNKHICLGGFSNVSWGAPVSPFGGSYDAWVVKITDDHSTPTMTPTTAITWTPTPTMTPAFMPFISPTLTANLVLVKNLINLSRGDKVIFRFSLDKSQAVNVQIYDLGGSKMFDCSQMLSAGAQDVVWDGAAAGAGVYMAYIQWQGGNERKKFVLVH